MPRQGRGLFSLEEKEDASHHGAEIMAQLCYLFMVVFLMNMLRLATSEFDCTNKEDGRHPDTSNCKKFFECVNKEAFHETCPRGLHYKKSDDSCTSPDLAKCEKPPKSPSSAGSAACRSLLIAMAFLLGAICIHQE